MRPYLARMHRFRSYAVILHEQRRAQIDGRVIEVCERGRPRALQIVLRNSNVAIQSDPEARGRHRCGSIARRRRTEVLLGSMVILPFLVAHVEVLSARASCQLGFEETVLSTSSSTEEWKAVRSNSIMHSITSMLRPATDCSQINLHVIHRRPGGAGGRGTSSKPQSLELRAGRRADERCVPRGRTSESSAESSRNDAASRERAKEWISALRC